MFGIPQNLKPVLLYNGAANAVACDIISCKTAKKVWFLIFHAGANDTDLTLSLEEAKEVAGSTHQAVTKTCPIWKDIDAGTTSDEMTRQTDAVSLVIDPATQNPVLAVIEWDPAKFSDGYDCIYLADALGHANNTVQIFGFILPRYKQDIPPSVIID